MIQTWRIDTPVQTLVLASQESRLPTVVYWGQSLPLQENLAVLAAAAQRDITGGMLDGVPDLSVSPQAGDPFPGQPGMQLRDAKGKGLLPVFSLALDESADNSLCLTYKDAALGLSYVLEILAQADSDVLRLSCALQSHQPIFVDWLAAPVLPAPQQSEHMLEFSGRWCGEFQMNEVPWNSGARLRECRLGRTSHEHFPGVILPCRGATNSQGQAFGLHYGWSGGHRMLAEELPDGRRQLQFGHASQPDQALCQSVTTAPLFATFSACGLNGLGAAFQSHLRQHVLQFPDAARPRPVHYNCWEAVYFKHDLDTLKDIAQRAAALGAERFVLDDGWFKGRDDDTSSLGDWLVDRRKFPEGLTPLIDYVKSLGMSFGLWFEPEMVNPDSDLYRAHPDWALGRPEQLLGRQQMVLDLSQSAVCDYLFERISSLLSEYDIDYIKWDHNRVLPTPVAGQTEAVYGLLDALRSAHPSVEIESCASGGGRIDFGILQRTHRVWLSDSNDAIERFWMQRNAALFLPSEVTGSHVGPRLCHTSGRVMPIGFRAWVAASRHMGFEMDPRELTDDEARVLQDATDWYKANRDWLHQGHILRLDSDDAAVLGELQLARDGQRFVAFVGQITPSAQTLPRPIRLTGLAPDALYQIQLRNPDQAAAVSRGKVALKVGPLSLSGRALMELGLQLPIAFPATLWVIEGKKL
uniref:alpha-galactosidase n=1 Tax=Marinobacterium profundum TaxID=1714300 RepID=UPI00082E2370|nr:alpha-galactosidase [Marinobacterium profundum]